MAYNSTSWTPDTLTKASNLTSTSNDVTIIGSLVVDDIKIDGNTIGHTDDTDLLSFASGTLTVNGTIVGDLTGDVTGNTIDGGSSALILKSSNSTAIKIGTTDSPELQIGNANVILDKGKFIMQSTVSVGSSTNFSLLAHDDDTGDLVNIRRPDDTLVFEIENDGDCNITGDLAFKVATTNTVDFYASADSASSGTGTVKMGNSTAANSAGWILVKVGGASKYIPFWTTSAPSP